MADIYTPPPDTAYRLVSPFYMPGPDGDRWAIALSGTGASIMNAAIAIAITMAFSYVWTIVTFIFMLFKGSFTTRTIAASNPESGAYPSPGVNPIPSPGANGDADAVRPEASPRAAQHQYQYQYQNNSDPEANQNHGQDQEVMAFSRRKFAALVTLWNSNDPSFAFSALGAFAYNCARDMHENSKKNKKNKNKTVSRNSQQSVVVASQQQPVAGQQSPPRRIWPDFWFALSFCLLGLAVYVATQVIGILAPSWVEIGNVAPVRGSILFYPAQPFSDQERLRDFGLRAPAVLRALGSVEAADVTVRSSVRVSDLEGFGYRDDNETEPVRTMSYGYDLDGVDLGLQGGNKLRLAVAGSCTTEYGWTDPTDPRYAGDHYRLWGRPDNETRYAPWVVFDNATILRAPVASFYLHPDGAQQLASDSNVSYAILVHSARRASISPSDDPWYATERLPAGYVRPYNAEYWMRRRRPVLSCWEKDSWSYGGKAVASVLDLRSTPGVDVPEVLLDILETTLSAGPMIVRLGSASGDSALRSRTTSPNGVIDARLSTVHDDMERLIVASFVATRNIFSDATMFGKPNDYRNVFADPSGGQREGSDRFVISSREIRTFSLTGLVSLGAIMVALFLATLGIKWIIRFHDSNPDWIHFTLLSAPELLRCAYEPDDFALQGGRSLASWPCASLVPRDEAAKEVDDHGTFVPHICDKPGCKGHILKIRPTYRDLVHESPLSVVGSPTPGIASPMSLRSASQMGYFAARNGQGGKSEE